jgi:hypothetical protein
VDGLAIKAMASWTSKWWPKFIIIKPCLINSVVVPWVASLECKPVCLTPRWCAWSWAVITCCLESSLFF